MTTVTAGPGNVQSTGLFLLSGIGLAMVPKANHLLFAFDSTPECEWLKFIIEIKDLWLRSLFWQLVGIVFELEEAFVRFSFNKA
jgi:hypothetical protein